jgi:hypothetical protein
VFTNDDARPVTVPPRPLAESRLAGAAAIAFAICFVIYLSLVDMPDLTTTNQATIAFYHQSSHLLRLIFGAYVGAAAAALFLTFMVCVVGDLRGRGRRTAAATATCAGTVFASLHLVASALFAAPSFAVLLNNEPVTIGADFALAARTASVVGDTILLLFACFAAAAFVGVTSWAERADGSRSRWFTIFSGMVAIALVAPMPFFSLLAFLLWCLTIGTRLVLAQFHRSARKPTTAHPNAQSC